MGPVGVLDADGVPCGFGVHETGEEPWAGEEVGGLPLCGSGEVGDDAFEVGCGTGAENGGVGAVGVEDAVDVVVGGGGGGEVGVGAC